MAATAPLAHTATGDMFNVAAYTDNKMRVAVFSAEQRRRTAEGVTVPAVPAVVVEAERIVAAEADAHACTSACTGAISHPTTCECICGGVNHGAQHVAGRRLAVVGLRSTYVRTGFTAAMLDAIGDDEAW
jgi:hypothetical protein